MIYSTGELLILRDVSHVDIGFSGQGDGMEVRIYTYIKIGVQVLKAYFRRVPFAIRAISGDMWRCDISQAQQFLIDLWFIFPAINHHTRYFLVVPRSY